MKVSHKVCEHKVGTFCLYGVDVIQRYDVLQKKLVEFLLWSIV